MLRAQKCLGEGKLELIRALLPLLHREPTLSGLNGIELLADYILQAPLLGGLADLSTHDTTPQ
jgi:hypothetical protein